MVESARQENLHFLKGNQRQDNRNPVPKLFNYGFELALLAAGEGYLHRKDSSGNQSRLEVQVRAIGKKWG